MRLKLPFELGNQVIRPSPRNFESLLFIGITLAPAHIFQISLEAGNRRLAVPETANMRVRGTMNEVTETLELLAWLGCIFRLPLPGKLTMSYIRFYQTSQNDRDINGSIATRLELLTARHQDPEPGLAGTCWVHLFNQSIVARGFEIAARSNVKGLEISPSMMIALAGVQSVENHKNGLFFLGETSMLYPSGHLNDSIQWHFVEAKDKITLLKILHESSNRLYTLDLERLMYGRSFLGVFGISQVHLATQQGLHQEIQDCGLPSTGQQFELVKELNLDAGIRIPHTPVSLSMGLKFRLTPRQLHRIPGQEMLYRDRLARHRDQLTLLFATDTKNAWMVSQLTVILRLALSYLMKNKDNFRKLSFQARRHLPYAGPCADDGDAAFRAIYEASEIVLWQEKGDEKPTLFRIIVEGFLNIFESIEWDSVQKDINSGFKIQSGLTGWDFKDLETRKHHVSPRTLSKAHKAPWWSMIKKSQMLVIYGSDFGPVICRDKSKVKGCSGWESIPAQKNLLAVTIPTLQRFARHNKQDESCHFITEKVHWHRPEGSRLFGDCTESCNPVQEFCKVKSLRFRHSVCFPPGKLREEGAVVFGVHADFCPRITCHALDLVKLRRGHLVLQRSEVVILEFYIYWRHFIFIVAVLVTVRHMYCYFVSEVCSLV